MLDIEEEEEELPEVHFHFFSAAKNTDAASEELTSFELRHGQFPVHLGHGQFRPSNSVK